ARSLFFTDPPPDGDIFRPYADESITPLWLYISNQLYASRKTCGTGFSPASACAFFAAESYQSRVSARHERTRLANEDFAVNDWPPGPPAARMKPHPAFHAA